MPITSPNRKITDLKFWLIEDADLDDAVWSGRKFTRRDLVLNIDTGSLRKGPGVWEDMQVVVEMGSSYSPPIPTSDVDGLDAALLAANPTYIIDTGSTNTAQDPGQNAIRINHASLASATELSMSDVDAMGIDQSTLNSLVGGLLVLRTVDSGATCVVRIKKAVHTSFTRFTIGYLKGTFPADGAVVNVRFVPDPSVPDVWVDGSMLSRPTMVVVTGTTSAGYGRAVVNLTTMTPALTNAILVNAYAPGTWPASPNQEFRIVSSTPTAYTVEFLDANGDTVADGTAWTLIFMGQRT